MLESNPSDVFAVYKLKNDEKEAKGKEWRWCRELPSFGEEATELAASLSGATTASYNHKNNNQYKSDNHLHANGS